MEPRLCGFANLSVGLLFAYLLGAAAPVTAQGLHLGDWEGAVEVRAHQSSLEIETKSPSPIATDNENTRMEERITIRNRNAYLLDPKLMTLTLGGTFGLSQEQSEAKSSSSEFKDERDADLSGFDFFAGIFPGNDTFSANLFANRNTFVQTRELAGRSDIEIENRGMMLFARRLYIPSTLSIRTEFNEQEARSGSIVSRTDERRDIVSYDGRRGWENAQMVMRYQIVDKSDEVRRELDFKSEEGNLFTSVDFGPALNRRWDSRIRIFSREDFSEEDRVDVDQFMRLEHTDRLETGYRYFLSNTDRLGGEVSSQTASFFLNHRLYESLRTDFQLDSIDESFDNGGRTLYRARSNFAYTKRLPLEGRLLAGLNVSTEKEDDDFSEAFVPQEQHTFGTPFAVSVALDNPNVVEGSVEVTKVANGEPVAGCTTFSVPVTLIEGVDYTLQTVGNSTEIVPLPCSLTTPGLNAGDTIAVDYRFTRGGAPVEFTTDTYRVSVSVDYRWIRPFFIHEQTNQELVAGSDGGFLTDRQADIVGLELRQSGRRLQSGLQVQIKDYQSEDQAFEELRTDAFLRYTLTAGLWLIVNARQSFTDFSFPEVRETDARVLRATLTYARSASLYAAVYATVEDFDDTLVQPQRTTEAGVEVRWQLGKLEVDPSLRVIDVERGNTDSREYRAIVRVIRRFF